MPFAEILAGSSLATGALALIATLALMPPLMVIGRRLGLVDRPDARKRHEADTPLVGGPAVLGGALLSLLLLQAHDEFAVLIPITLGICLLGVLDDRLDLSPITRVVFQLAAASAMILGGLRLYEIGDLIGQGPVVLGTSFGLFFTALCTVGVINSINMIDGLDGLAGSILLVSFGALMALAVGSAPEYAAAVPMLAAFSGALLAFLAFNLRLIVPRARVFLGDSGSMVLGFVLLWYCIRLTQGADAPVSPVLAGWIFGLPLMDTVSVMVGRLVRGRSPLSAGRDHFHHLLVDAGASVNATVAIMVGVHVSIVLIGCAFNTVPAAEPFLFWAFVLMVIAHHFLTPRLVRHLVKRPTLPGVAAPFPPAPRPRTLSAAASRESSFASRQTSDRQTRARNTPQSPRRAPPGPRVTGRGQTGPDRRGTERTPERDTEATKP